MLHDQNQAFILMLKDAHFSGSFPLMIDYWRKGGRGAHEEVSLNEIEKLAALELEMGENLAAHVLTGADAEKVHESKEIYKKLRDLYETQKENSIPLVIADLILTEDEFPEKEIEAIIVRGNEMIPFLIEIISSKSYYDPLLPGYGLTPKLAAFCLGKIGNKRAIIALFESLENGDFEHEEMALKALETLGEPARDFLMQVVGNQPITFDNEKAALALIQFKDHDAVAKKALQLLQQEAFLKSFPLNSYLALIAEGLKDPSDREAFAAIAKNNNLDKTLKKDIEAIVSEWE